MKKSNFLKNHQLISEFLSWPDNMIIDDDSEKKIANTWGIKFFLKDTSSLLTYDFVDVIHVFSIRNNTLTKKLDNLYLKN